MRPAAFVLGVIVLLGTGSSVLRTLVVPRNLRTHLGGMVQTVTLGAFRFVARRTRTYERRDSVLTWAAPSTIVITLVVWLALLLLGYWLVLIGIAGGGSGSDLREAGSSLLTLGFASTAAPWVTAVDFAAAATGPILIGLFIGYLSTVYTSYNRREREVTLLTSRAGEPNWGPEIVMRHLAVRVVDELPTLWHAWESWAADVAESHANYPILIHVRSSKPNRNWLLALLSVMDAAAMSIALNPGQREGPARVTLRQGITCLRDLAEAERIQYNADPDPDTPIALPETEFTAAVDRLVAAGYESSRTAAEAWPHFRGWRINYEQIAYALAERIDAPPGRWSGVRRPPLPEADPYRPINRMPGGRVGPPDLPKP